MSFGLSSELDRIEKCATRLSGNWVTSLWIYPILPRAALEEYQETLTERLKHSDPNSSIIADVEESIACT